jgi:hypothetical protein
LTPNLRQRNKAAARARGAAMVEAIIVISVMIVFYGGMVYFESLYHSQIVVQSQARSAAVANAMDACQGSMSEYTGPAPASIIGLPRTHAIPTGLGDITVAGQTGFMNGLLSDLDLLSAGSFVDVLSADNATVAVTAGSNTYRQNVSSNAFAACADTIAVNGEVSQTASITQKIQTAYTGPE